MKNRELKREDEILIQSYLMMRLLNELVNQNFVQSEYFKNLKFTNDNTKNFISEIGLDNQGSRMIMLYILLVLPRELIFKKYESEFNELDEKLNEIKLNKTISTYKYDSKCINMTRRMRNALAHGKLTFEKEYFTFYDFNPKNEQEYCKIFFKNEDFPFLLESLNRIFNKYLENL